MPSFATPPEALRRLDATALGWMTRERGRGLTIRGRLARGWIAMLPAVVAVVVTSRLTGRLLWAIPILAVVIATLPVGISWSRAWLTVAGVILTGTALVAIALVYTVAFGLVLLPFGILVLRAGLVHSARV